MRPRAMVAVVGLAVGVAACTTDTSGAPDAVGAPPPQEASPAGPDGGTLEPTPVEASPGVVRLQGCEPRGLLPSDASRRCGQQVLDGLFSPLVALDPDDAAPRWGRADDAAVADSVTSLDARRWVIELKEGWQFHDGTPVTAQSFVDAWNYASYGPNGQANAFLFEPILGFSDLHCPDPGCEPTDTTLDGVRAIDDMTLEVVLAAPDRTFPRRLGHIAFAPLPAAALEDVEAFREAPVGNGPFRMEGPWVHEERISLRAVEDHAAGAPAIQGVDILLFDDLEQAWQALAEGRLDIATALPVDRWEAAEDAFTRLVRDGDDYEALVVPSSLPQLAEDDRLARALSMAIDRPRVIEAHLDGAARPARGLVPAVVSDEVDRCRGTCRFQPSRARDLLAQVGIPEDGIELWYDRAGGQEPWVRAIAVQLRQHLGLDRQQVRVRSLPHPSWVSHLQDRRIGGLYPIGWSMDVASPAEYLVELHGPGGLFNFDRYVGAETGALLAEAAAARNAALARMTYRQVERAVLADMHHIPLWTRTHEVWHAGRVAGVALDGRGDVRLAELAVDEEV